jgi:aryl sulfotransferase
MAQNKIISPEKTLVDFLSDSRPWQRFIDEDGFMDTDIVIADPFKAGTTWTQRIIQQILSNGEESNESLSDKSPWIDSSWGDHEGMIRKLQEQKAKGMRRVIKSHLPAYTVPISDKPKYIFVGRNGKDLLNSFHNYLFNFNSDTMQTIEKVYKKNTGENKALNIPESSSEFFDLMLNSDGYGCCDIFDVTLSWWNLRELPNVAMVHYSRLLNNFEQEVIRLAEFVGADLTSLDIDKIVAHCDFNYMKQNSEKLVPFNGKHMTSSGAFFHKGPKRNFKSELSPEQISRFDQIALEKMGPRCAAWLESGNE